MSAERKTRYITRKNTPCPESIAMPRPDVPTTSTANQSFHSGASPVSTKMAGHTFKTDDSVSAKNASAAGGPSASMPPYTIGTNEDMEAFLSGIMDDNPLLDEIKDDEYYLFGGQGSDNDSMDGDEDGNTSSAAGIDLDHFDYVYSNIPDSTHILKHTANCDHCKAKKFQYETDGFCCRNGQIKLKELEPIPELMRLWSSTDADSRHFR